MKRARVEPWPALARRSSASTPLSSLSTLTTSGSIGVKACSAPR
jgi:hypothetical protein